MDEPRRPLSDDDVERTLRAASASLRYPQTPPIAATVRARLLAGVDARPAARGPFAWPGLAPLLLLVAKKRPHPRPLPEGEGVRARSPLPLGEAGRSPRQRARTGEGVALTTGTRRASAQGSRPHPLWPVLRPALLGIAAVLVAALIISPDARSTVADRLGLRGVAITHVPAAPTSLARPHGLAGYLGRQLTLEQAQARVPFRILLPAELGPPDEVYLLDDQAVPYVSLVYLSRQSLPPSGATGVGLLLSQFRGRVDAQAVAGKLLPPGGSMEAVTVDGAPGFWLSGAPHGFFFQGPDGLMRSDGSRLAGNTLLWERDTVTFRLESALGKAEAIRLATSLR